MSQNKYLRTEQTLKELSRMLLSIRREVVKIEDLEIEGEPNVLIYVNSRSDGEEFVNIYGSVRIMVTKFETIDKDRYKKLPEHIEYVISDGVVFEVRNEMEMMRFMSNKSKAEYVREKIYRGEVNEVNRMGETMLIILCLSCMEDEALNLMERMSDEVVKMIYIKGSVYGSVLSIAIHYKMKRLAIAMIDRMSDEEIKTEEMKLITVCSDGNGMEIVALKLIRRMSKEGMSRWDDFGQTGLYFACLRKMESVALELIENMSSVSISRICRTYNTSLMAACHNGMERVAMAMIPKMTEEGINRWRVRKYNTALTGAIERNMERVAVELIKRTRYDLLMVRNDRGESVFYMLCKNRMIEGVRELRRRLREEDYMREVEEFRSSIMDIRIREVIEEKVTEE